MRPTTSWWCEHAWLPGGPAASVRIEAGEAGLIHDVAVGVDARPEDVRLPGLVLPGFANTHSHAFHRALRGRTHGRGGTFWTWRDRMYALADKLDPDTYAELATAVYAEMALAGVTCVGEFHYLHHGPGGARYGDPNAMGEALREAAARAGVRLTLLDTCYLRGGIDVPLEGVQRRFDDQDAESWANRVSMMEDDDNFRVAAAVHSVRAVPAEELDVVVEAAVGEDGMPAAARARLRAAGGERGVPGRLRLLADRAAGGARRARVGHHRRSRHARQQARHRAARGVRDGDLRVPDDRAGPRRRDRPRPRARRRRGAPDPGHGPARDGRHAGGEPRPGDARAAAVRPARPVHACRSSWRRWRRAGTSRSAGPRRVISRSGTSATSSRSGSTPCAPQAPCPSRSCWSPRRVTWTPSSAAAASSSRAAGTCCSGPTAAPTSRSGWPTRSPGRGTSTDPDEHSICPSGSSSASTGSS